MLADIAARNPIVKEVSENFSNEDGHNGGNIEKANALETVSVTANCNGLGEEDGGTDIDADRPRENE